MWGVVNYFNPFSLVHNDTPLRDSIGEDFYMTDFITEKSELLLDQFSRDEDPFYLYVAYNAPPLAAARSGSGHRQVRGPLRRRLGRAAQRPLPADGGTGPDRPGYRAGRRQ